MDFPSLGRFYNLEKYAVERDLVHNRLRLLYRKTQCYNFIRLYGKLYGSAVMLKRIFCIFKQVAYRYFLEIKARTHGYVCALTIGFIQTHNDCIALFRFFRAEKTKFAIFNLFILYLFVR